MNKRQYKKKYFICKDDFGKNIYAGDTIEIRCPVETNSSWESVVHWDMLHGAFIDSHPSHVSMGIGDIRPLYKVLGQGEIPIFYHGEDKARREKGYVKRVKSVFSTCSTT